MAHQSGFVPPSLLPIDDLDIDPITAAFIRVGDVQVLEAARDQSEDASPIGKAISLRRTLTELPEGTPRERRFALVIDYSRAIQEAGLPRKPVKTIREMILKLRERLNAKEYIVASSERGGLVGGRIDFQATVDRIFDDLRCLGVHERLPLPPQPERAENFAAVHNALNAARGWLNAVEASLADDETPKKGGRKGEYDDVALAAHQCFTDNPKLSWDEVHRVCLERFGSADMPSQGDRDMFPKYVRRRWKSLQLRSPK